MPSGSSSRRYTVSVQPGQVTDTSGNPVPANPYYRDIWDNSLSGIPRLAFIRHPHGVNLVYLDGHAARVPFAEMWMQYWYNGNTPRVVTVPWR